MFTSEKVEAQKKTRWPVKPNYGKISQRLRMGIELTYLRDNPAERLKVDYDFLSRVVLSSETATSLELLSTVSDICRLAEISSDWVLLGLDYSHRNPSLKGKYWRHHSANNTSPKFNHDEAWHRISGAAADSRFLNFLDKENMKDTLGKELSRRLGDYPSLEFLAAINKCTNITLDWMLLGTAPKNILISSYAAC